jgi:hypothetical protein
MSGNMYSKEEHSSNSNYLDSRANPSPPVLVPGKQLRLEVSSA